MSDTLPRSVADALQKADRTQLQLAGVGCFAQVVKVADTGFVIKKAFDHPIVGSLQPTEKRIYERLGHHPYILRYYGEYCQGNGLPNGLVFQYHRAGTLTDNIALSKYPEKRTRWPMQAAEALRFIHSKNVIHSDVGSHNFLIQEDGTLALADFGGSSIDDVSPVVSYSTRYARPCADDIVSTEIDDLFALGTIIYEISVGHLLYADRTSREVRTLLHQNEFPDLDTIPSNFKVVIRKCWSNGYQTAEEVIRDLERADAPMNEMKEPTGEATR